MFVLLMSRDLVQSTCKRKANGLVYSRCPGNTNDLAIPLLGQIPAIRPYLAQPRGTEYDRTAPGPRSLLQGVWSMGGDLEYFCENQIIDAGSDDKL